MPLVGAAGYVFLQMLQLVRQILFEVIHGRDLLGNCNDLITSERLLDYITGFSLN